MQPDGHRSFIFDQKRRNASLECLVNAIPSSVTRSDRAVQRDAEIRTRFHQFPVPVSDRRRSGLWPACQPNFNGNPQALACLIEGLINTRTAAVDNDDITAIAGDEPVQDNHRQVVADPCPVAGD
jgi:hypothetical protein